MSNNMAEKTCTICGSSDTDGLVGIPNKTPYIQKEITDRRYCYYCDGVYSVKETTNG